MNLKGKTAVVTGGSRGLGRAICLELAAGGANLVFCFAGNEAAAQETAQACRALGAEVDYLRCNVADSTQVKELMETAVQRFGRIDILVNNAGITRDGLMLTMKESDFDQVVETNLKGTFLCMKAVARQMIKQRYGRIINLSSVVGLHGNAGQVNYAASKAGAEALASALHSEVAHRGVAVGSAHPSWIDTDLVRDAAADLSSFRQMRKMLPWPMHATTTVDKCAAAFADAVEKRSRRVYVPRAIMLMHWLRNLPASKLVSKIMAPSLRRIMPQMEREVAELGRSFSARNQQLLGEDEAQKRA